MDLLAPNQCLYATYSKCKKQHCKFQHNVVNNPKVDELRKYLKKNNACISYYFYGKCGHKQEERKPGTHQRPHDEHQKPHDECRSEVPRKSLHRFVEELKVIMRGLYKIIPRRAKIIEKECSTSTVQSADTTQPLRPKFICEQITAPDSVKAKIIKSEIERCYSIAQRKNIRELENEIKKAEKHDGKHNKVHGRSCEYCHEYESYDIDSAKAELNEIRKLKGEEYEKREMENELRDREIASIRAKILNEHESYLARWCAAHNWREEWEHDDINIINFKRFFKMELYEMKQRNPKIIVEPVYVKEEDDPINLKDEIFCKQLELQNYYSMIRRENLNAQNNAEKMPWDDDDDWDLD